MLYPQTMEPTAGTQWKGGTEGLTSSTTLASSADVVAAVLGGPAFARNRLVSHHAHTAANVLSSDLEPLDVVAGHSALGALRPTRTRTPRTPSWTSVHSSTCGTSRTSRRMQARPGTQKASGVSSSQQAGRESCRLESEDHHVPGAARSCGCA